MRTIIANAARFAPGAANAIWKMLFPRLGKDIYWPGEEYGQGREAAFELIYRENRWNSPESRSGNGSTLNQTIFVRKHLPRLLSDLGARTLLDAPCGDYYWMQRVILPRNVHYIGGELVRPIVEDLILKYKRPGTDFMRLDIVSQPLPDADVWLCRDALFHFCFADIEAVFRNFSQSKVGYILTTTYPFTTVNRDINSGGFRFLNLTLPPFNLPQPRVQFDDFLAPETPRKLALWSQQDVAALYPAQ